jgi:hypothetical protein
MRPLSRLLAIALSLAFLLAAAAVPATAQASNQVSDEPVVVCTYSTDCGSLVDWTAPPECQALTDDEYAVWLVYVDWVDGYTDSGAELSNEQIVLYTECWGWWF